MKLADRLAAIEAFARAKEQKPHTPPESLEFAHLQLPLWPDLCRGVPNAALRCSLFAGIQGKTRRALKNELLATLNGQETRFTGWQWDQSDLDVFETVVHLARFQNVGNSVEFSAAAMLKLLHRGKGLSQYEWLKETLTRLAAGLVEIKIGHVTYFGHLFTGGTCDEKTGRYIIQLNPDLLTLYEGGWTQIQWQERQLLRRKPIALWLHGWYTSHAEPYDIKIETLRSLCGSRTKLLKKFKDLLFVALDDIKAIGVISEWSLRGDNKEIVHVERAPSPSQRRHLSRRAGRDKPKATTRPSGPSPSPSPRA